MAITFGNHVGNATQGDTTISHNNDGNYLIVCIDETGNNLTDVSYNGVSMTQIGTTKLNVVSLRYLWFFGLKAPASGSHNVVLTGGVNQNTAIQSMSGVDQTTPFVNAGSSSGISSTATLTITTITDNSFLVCAAFIRDISSSGTNTTQRQTTSNNTVCAIYSNTSAITPAGSASIIVNTTGSEWDMVGASFQPATSQNAAFFLVL